MLYALETSYGAITIGTGPEALRLTLPDDAKYKVLRRQNELAPNYYRYGLQRVTPDSFRGGKI